MDFRGRIYPIPPHVSHISMLVCLVGEGANNMHCGTSSSIHGTVYFQDPMLNFLLSICLYMYTCMLYRHSDVNNAAMDVGRALMTFACGHPLGADGLNWLKIHLVNLHGLKKK